MDRHGLIHRDSRGFSRHFPWRFCNQVTSFYDHAVIEQHVLAQWKCSWGSQTGLSCRSFHCFGFYTETGHLWSILSLKLWKFKTRKHSLSFVWACSSSLMTVQIWEVFRGAIRLSLSSLLRLKIVNHKLRGHFEPIRNFTCFFCFHVLPQLNYMILLSAIYPWIIAVLFLHVEN